MRSFPRMIPSSSIQVITASNVLGSTGASKSPRARRCRLAVLIILPKQTSPLPGLRRPYVDLALTLMGLARSFLRLQPELDQAAFLQKAVSRSYGLHGPL